MHGKLERSLDYAFDDQGLLQQALTHRSAGSRNNERLEFLGDAILGGVIAAELYRRYPGAKEGELSRLRANLVRRESLAEIAQTLDLGSCLTLGTGERKSGGHRRDSILSDTVEALLGAIFLDSDFTVCQSCILRLFSARLNSLSDVASLKDAKTRLQEYLQSRHQPLPEYTVKAVSGEAHAQFFRVECVVDDIGLSPGKGQGSSRRQAEQNAAEDLLTRLVG
ncbi:MAG TPA: ribonuclease III [Gammaproteobacteria bacterium]|nr:ribonuclease III [Gammaproteobacteria bacterium]